MTTADLYQRGCRTLVASWREYARATASATVEALPGVTVATFPREPERSVYNNALLDRGLDPDRRATAIAAMQDAYRAVGVAQFAAWVHESDSPMCRDLERRGYQLAESTRAMGLSLDGIRLPRPGIDLGRAGWPEYLQHAGLPPDFLPGVDPAAFHLLVARDDGRIVAAALAFDHGTDCGIYNVQTAEHARRRGLGTALTAAQLSAAAVRGCRTASLQSSPMAERVYAALGFRDLGRILEYAPPHRGAE